MEGIDEPNAGTFEMVRIASRNCEAVFKGRGSNGEIELLVAHLRG